MSTPSWRRVKLTGADAIHPGYGFLSERVALAEYCAANGIAWVGPSANAIARMGSKIESKRIAEAADVPCVPRLSRGPRRTTARCSMRPGRSASRF